jgi:hypothetical protein
MERLVCHGLLYSCCMSNSLIPVHNGLHVFPAGFASLSAMSRGEWRDSITTSIVIKSRPIDHPPGPAESQENGKLERAQLGRHRVIPGRRGRAQYSGPLGVTQHGTLGRQINHIACLRRPGT